MLSTAKHVQPAASGTHWEYLAESSKTPLCKLLFQFLLAWFARSESFHLIPVNIHR